MPAKAGIQQVAEIHGFPLTREMTKSGVVQSFPSGYVRLRGEGRLMTVATLSMVSRCSGSNAR